MKEREKCFLETKSDVEKLLLKYELVPHTK